MIKCLNCGSRLEDYYNSTQYCDENCLEEHKEYLEEGREDDSP